ncbi:MAG: ABC transporter ATP-binding protein [Bacillota bacterium]|nr:ABC transporter ATP-binding protein [Bacillota bacterium]
MGLLLRAVNLRRVFVQGRRVVHALAGVSLAVAAGEFLVVTGPSGCGKTTLLNILTGMDRPSAGEVVLGDVAYSTLSEDGLSALRRERLGYVFQFYNLLPHLTALENVALPLRFRGWDAARAARRAREILEEVGLGARMRHRPGQLSGGEQQRVAIARAVAHDPDLVLADEPTGNLDSRAAARVADLFAQINGRGRTLVVVSHDPALVERAEKVLAMRDGAVAGSASSRCGGQPEA